MIRPERYNYDVAYVGAGPFGITAACVLKAINNGLRIIVLEKRLEGVRNHGLNTAADSVDFFNERMKMILAANLSCSERNALTKLDEQFQNWKKKFIRTTEIENKLGQFAETIGIPVKRGEAYDVKEDQIEKLLDPNLEESRSELGQLLNAEVIVGADGAKSAIRKSRALFANVLTESITLQYMIELKYQTDGRSSPRETKEAVKMSSACGTMGIESMNPKSQEKDKPVTLHSFVRKELFDSLLLKNKDGQVIKGTFANPWTIEELKERAQVDRHAKEVHMQILRYLVDLGKREGVCKEPKISTLELTIYRSEKAVMEYQGHYVLLGGDAFAGMILERGWSKSIMEAILSSIAIHNFFQLRHRHTGEIPLPFRNYESEVKRIYENEKWWALKKNTLISGVNTVAGLFSQWVFQPVNSVEKTIKQVKEDVQETTAFISSKVSKYSSSKEYP